MTHHLEASALRYVLGRCRLLELFKETGTGPQDIIERTAYRSSEISDWAHNRKKMSLATALSVCKAMGWDIYGLYELNPVPKSQKRVRQPKEG